jgi:mono/diheme cytochrome c family protein
MPEKPFAAGPALLGLLGLLGVALATGCSARRSEPIDTSPEVARGGIAFDRHCSHCHPGGERGLAPALNDKPLPGFLIRFQVRHGAGAMPAFPRQTIDDQELDDIVRYLKALRRH